MDEDKVFLASVLPMGPVFGIKHSMGSPASVGICSKMDKTLGFSSFRLHYWMVDMCCPTNHCCCHKLARSRQKPTKKKVVPVTSQYVTLVEPTISGTVDRES